MKYDHDKKKVPDALVLITGGATFSQLVCFTLLVIFGFIAIDIMAIVIGILGTFTITLNFKRAAKISASDNNCKCGCKI